MPIRTKPEVQYYLVCPPGQGGGSGCTTASSVVAVPIRDWKIEPNQLNKVWQQGSAVPSQLFQDIIFPELEHVYQYSDYRYKLKKNISSGAIDFLVLSSSKLVGDTFNQTNLITERLFCDFQNLDNLSVGNHVIPVVIEAYGLDSNNQEHYVESFYTEISITVQPGTGIATDKNSYNVSYNIADQSFSGDLKITAFVQDQLIVTSSHNYITLNQITVGNQRQMFFQNNAALQALAVGNYSGSVTLKLGSATKIVSVNIEVINDPTLFYVDPVQINFTLQKNLSEVKNLSADLINPNNLNIIIESFPSFINSCSINNGVIEIETVNSAGLNLGNYAGDIILRAGGVYQIIELQLSVIESIKHDFLSAQYYFAKDKNKVILTKTTASASYVKMILEMYFAGFGEEYQEIQEYFFPYFKGKTEIFPGSEIQDFFIKAKNVNTILGPNYQYDLAFVNMTFIEMDSSDQEITRFNIDQKYFAPGRKPKYFPIFTDYGTRGTYNGSNIKLNCDRLGVKPEITGLLQNYGIPSVPLPSKYAVDQHTFLRFEFNNDIKNSIINSGELSFIPLPDPENIIHIEWENQNLVFDWFSASGVADPTAELEALLGESKNYVEEKFGSKKTMPLTVSSGWILKEEIPLITDLLESRLCFIYSGGKRFKAFPIGTKNELKGDDNTLSMDLEFKILFDER